MQGLYAFLLWKTTCGQNTVPPRAEDVKPSGG